MRGLGEAPGKAASRGNLPPQKGATPGEVEVLDRALRHYAEVIRRDLGLDRDLDFDPLHAPLSRLEEHLRSALRPA